MAVDNIARGMAAKALENQGGGGSSLPIVNTATVGQTIRVYAVDETGNPTEWEAVEFPAGGGEWELIIDTTFTEAAGLDTGEIPGKTKMMCVFAAPKGDEAVVLYTSAKAFGKSLGGFAMVSATYGKIGFIFAEKLYENSIVYFGSGDTTSTTPTLDTTARANVTTAYNRITTDITDVPLRITQELPAGTIIKVFVQ